jgi:hypothetical protein
MTSQRIAIGLLLLPSLARAADKTTYQDHILPILESKCFSCHDPDKKKGGLDLTNFTNLMAGSSGGEIVNPGNPGDSTLIKVLTKQAEPYMPPKGDPLPKDQIELISKWINEGVLETSNSQARKSKKPAFSMQVDASATGKPEGPPPMPEHLLLEPVITTARASATAALATSPWAPLAAVSGQHQVLLYNTDTLRLAGVLPFPEGFAESLVFSPNGSLLLAGGGRGGKSGRVVGWEVKTGRRVIELGTEFDTILAAGISADHSLVAFGGPSKKVKIFTTSNGEELVSIKKHTDWVTAISFTPDGILFASGDRSGNLYVWESGTGNLFYDLRGHQKAITGLSWRADSNILASSSEDGTIRLWEMGEGKEVKKWDAHGGVLNLRFQQDGRLVSCGRDNQTKLWDQNGAEQGAITGFKEMPLLTSFTHDGQRVLVGDWAGEISVWSGDGKARIGELSANPPALDTRIAETMARVPGLEKAAADAQATLDMAVAALNAKKSELEALKASMAPSMEDRGTKEVALNQAKEVAAKALAARDQAKQEFEARKADPAAAPAAQQLVTQREEELNTANAAVPLAQAAFDAATKKITDVEAAIAAADPEVAKMVEAEKPVREAAELAGRQLAEARNDLKQWNAAKVNTTRLALEGEIPKLEEAFEVAKADFDEIAKAKELASTEIGVAEEAAKQANAFLEARMQELAKAKDDIPGLQAKVLLTQVIADNAINARELLAKGVAETEGEVKAKMEAAAAAAEQAIASNKAQLDQLRDQVENGVARAEQAVTAAQMTQEAVAKVETEKRAVVAAIETQLQTAEAARKTAEARLAETKIKGEELKNQYLAMLAGN